MQERSKTGFIRDLVIKIFLILLFVFLITLLFPMPNLTPFYNRIFNDNIQTMKDAAENYFTTERMPEKVGDTSKLTLQQMIDKKLILPFTDQEGKECDTKKSYVKVTKKEKEYELEVHLTCGKETNYIVEPIGCYNFCPDNSCKEITTNEETGKVVINKPENNKDNSEYKLQYLYSRTLTDTTWKNGDWTTTKQNETSDVKLVETKTQYTGQKKVTKGTTTYKHRKYVYTDNWTIDKNWTDEVKTLTDKLKLYDTRTLYTGQRKIEKKTKQYQHVKYTYSDNWTIDKNWTDEVKKETDNLKLYDTRTLYTGQKRVAITQTQYQHIKYAYKDNWTETDWITNNYNTNDKVVLLAKRYTVQKTVKTSTGGWGAWTKDTTWRTSKPADTATTQWSDPYKKKTTVAKGSLIYADYKTTDSGVANTDTRIYELDHISQEPCVGTCASSIQTVYHYRVYQKITTVSYLYMYRNYSSSESISTDTQVVTDPTPWQAKGYTITKYEYKYKINSPTKYIADTKWTTSKTSPSGYEYTGKTQTITTGYNYEDLGKWVTSKSALGEYTYNIKTKKQYKYKYNTPTKTEEFIWTDSITPPKGYTYTGNFIENTTPVYEDLGKWVTSKSALGEYTYNIKTKKQYKYMYNNPTKTEEFIWTDSITPPKGYEYTGEYKTSSSTTTYIDLGKWVDSKKELGEYTYNVSTRVLYKYKYKNTTTRTESKWFDSNPGGDWVYANQTRKVEVSTKLNK